MEGQTQLELPEQPEQPIKVPIDVSKYRMKEETLGEIEDLMEAIRLIRDIRSVMPLARILRSKLNLILVLWWPVTVLLAIFVSGLPQDLGAAILLLVTMLYIVGIAWVSAMGDYVKTFRRWHRRVAALYDLSAREIRLRVREQTRIEL